MLHITINVSVWTYSSFTCHQDGSCHYSTVTMMRLQSCSFFGIVFSNLEISPLEPMSLLPATDREADTHMHPHRLCI